MTSSSSSSSSSAEPDRGLAEERTRLAWRRTTLAATIVLVVAASGVLTRGVRPMSTAVLAAMVALWLRLLVLAHRRIASLSRGRDPMVRQPIAVASMAAVMALVGIVLALLRPLR